MSVSCAETNLVVISEVNDEFYGIESIEVNAAFLELNYEGSDRLTEVTRKGIIRSSGNAN